MIRVFQMEPLTNPVNIDISVPASKSQITRAMLLAAISDGRCVLENTVLSEDSEFFLNALRDLGFSVSYNRNVKQIRIVGENGRIPKKEATIYVGSAGTAARFLSALLGLSEGRYTIQASDQMKKRPMQELFHVLEDLGASITYLEEDGCLPVTMVGALHNRKSQALDNTVEYKKQQEIMVDITRSTQFLSALMMVLAVKPFNTRVNYCGTGRSAYIKLTAEMMRRLGYQIHLEEEQCFIPGNQLEGHTGTIIVEPDVSGACYFYTIPVLCGGKALVRGIHANSMQGDFAYIKVLEKMGAIIEDAKEGITVSYDREKGLPQPSDLNMNDFSDQALTFAVLAAYLNGDTKITGIAHIKEQECNRIEAICNNLQKVGIQSEVLEDGILIHGGKPQGAVLETYEDHRVAMAFGLMCLVTEGIVINNPQCCKKTFTDYFKIMSNLRQL